MSKLAYGEIPKMLLGVDANKNKGLRVKLVNYAGTMDCNVPLSQWLENVIEIDANGTPRLRLVIVPEGTFTCADASDYGIEVCGAFLGYLVKADDGGHALLLLT